MVILVGLSLMTKGAQAIHQMLISFTEAPSPINSHLYPLFIFSIEMSAFFWLVCRSCLCVVNVNPLEV